MAKGHFDTSKQESDQYAYQISLIGMGVNRYAPGFSRVKNCKPTLLQISFGRDLRPGSIASFIDFPRSNCINIYS